MKRLAVVTIALLLVSPAAPAQAAAEGGMAFFWEWFNLVLLLAVLVWVARKPVLGFLAQRRTRIQEDIATSERLLADAEAKLEEWSGKAARLEGDIAEIRQLTSQRAEGERSRILEEAERVAERVRRDAAAAVDRELDRARKSLRKEASDLAVELAGKLLAENVNDADRTRLLDEFVTRLESGASAGPGSAGSGSAGNGRVS